MTGINTDPIARINNIYAQITDRPEVFIHVRHKDVVLQEYCESARSSAPLAGMILAVKDNVDVAGVPTTAACPGYAYTPDVDAAAVAALRDAGAVILGKTNLDQFATGLVGTRSPYGAVRDSRRLDHISGGSSSGSAVAVALGMADIAIGTDTAGSGRVPAGLQGIVGIKPTIGTIHMTGVVPACESYDCVTIFARDLPTANTAMRAMSNAVGTRPFPADTRFAAGPAPTIAVPTALPELDDAWHSAFDTAVNYAVAAGFQVIPVDISDFLAAAKLLYEGALVSERFDAVGDFVAQSPDGPGSAGLNPTVSAGLDPTVSAGLDPTVTAIISAAGRFSATDLLIDRRRVDKLRAQAMTALGGSDALMVPTAPMHPTLAEVEADPIGVNARMGTYTNFCNLFDMCGVAVPIGVVDEGDRGIAQFGVTLLGRSHHDGVVMDLARRLTYANTPSVTGSCEPGSSWVESRTPAISLAVFGAHLRGQPLAHQLRERGARWDGPITTADTYRLVALDTNPPKPGLVHDPADGRSIRGERWLLSPAALGSFLAELPQPMTLGAITLSDGSTAIGFGCQQSAANAAEPIDADHWLAGNVAT